MTLEEARRLFDRRIDAWLREDLEAYFDLWAEEVSFSSPGQTIRGRVAYEGFVRASAERVRPVAFDVHELAVAGEAVLAEWTITVEARSSKRLVSWRGMSAAVIHDGRIADWREYWDPGPLLEALRAG